MATRRVARVSQAVLETVSTSVLFQLRDPRIKDVTILRVEVSGDTRTAKVYVSVRGSERDRALCLKGLDSSRGFLQKKVADRIQTRFTPVLTFVLDDDVGAAAEATRILDELALERGATADDVDEEANTVDGEAETVDGDADTDEEETEEGVELTESEAGDLASMSSVDAESED